MATIDDIIKYVQHTPENTNPAVLKSMLQDYGGRTVTDDHINELINTALESFVLQSETDAIDLLTELGFVNPIADENNAIYTEDNTIIYLI